MLFRKFSLGNILICFVVLGLLFSVTGCKLKKQPVVQDGSGAVASGSAATQSGSQVTTPPSGQSTDVPPQSSPLGSSSTVPGLDDTNKQAEQNPVTFGAYALWTGKWETTFFRYGGSVHTTIWDLKQVQSNVTGTYDWDDGKITCKQSKTSGYMIGTWSEAPTYQPPDDAGDLELQQSVDGNRFTGKWRYGSSGDWVGEWNGKRIR
jgi:hypothetical protein